MSTKKKRRWMAGAVFPVAVVAAVAFAALAGAATQVAPVNTTPPTISGTAKVGQTLTAGDGTWSNTPTSYAYQWLRCNGGGNSCVNVANGTQKTYTLVGADSRPHDARPGDGHQRRRLRFGPVGSDGSGRGGNIVGSAEEHVGTDDHGHAEGRADADRRQRQLVRQPDHLHLRVAALRR